MKLICKTIILSSFALASSLPLLAQAAPLEICSVGTDCAYNVSGHSGRPLTFTGFEAGNKYQCVFQNVSCHHGGKTGNFQLLNVEKSDPNLDIKYINGNATVENGNGLWIDATSARSGSLDFRADLRNKNFWGQDCDVTIRCSEK